MNDSQRSLPFTTPPLLTWLDVLFFVLPPRGVLLAGAGTGNSSWVRWLKARHVSSVCLVEGNEHQYRHLQRQLHADSISQSPNRFSGWRPRQDVLSGTHDQVTFYEASNPAESGIVEPERLQELWPNLTIDRAVTRDAITLDSLHEDTGLDANWLLLDCLPAAELLRGGEKLLSTLDLALVRVTTERHVAVTPPNNYDAVDTLMQRAGLTLVHLEPERHPALAHALYTRSAQKLAEKLEAEQQHTLISSKRFRDAQEEWHKERNELARELEGARIEGRKIADESKISASRISELVLKLDATQIEFQKISAELRICQQEKDALLSELKTTQDNWTREREELSGKLKEAHVQLHRLSSDFATIKQENEKSSEHLQATQNCWTQERAKLTQEVDLARLEISKMSEKLKIAQEHQIKLAEQLRTTREEWLTEKNTLTQAHERIEQLATERQTKLKASEQLAIQLKNRLDETDRRNRLLDAEIDKAEVQIELIREFLKLQAKI
ncbi:MAG: hypothetical protein QJR04_00395 [Burkholderia multivorans]|nr:hypothetical protein [Burkholderia multivorans]